MQKRGGRRAARLFLPRNLQEARQVERSIASFWRKEARALRELTRIDGRVIITNENALI
jgi:hypothetical protein